MLKPTKLRGKKRGQALAEFALVIPVLLFIFFAIIDFGRILVTYAQASAAIRNALRYGVILGFTGGGSIPNYLNCQAMHDTAGNIIFGEGTTVTVEYRKASDLADGVVNSPIACTPGMDAAARAALDAQIDNGDILYISVTTNIRLLTPFFVNQLTLRLEGQRTLVRDIELPRPDAAAACDNDGICDTGEDYHSCPYDCPYCNNNGTCDAGLESATGCPADCPCNNDATCDAGEDAAWCADCSASGFPLPVVTNFQQSVADTFCNTSPANRYIGLQWTPVADIRVEGYFIYATPAGGTYAGQTKRVGMITGRTSSGCGGAVGACFNYQDDGPPVVTGSDLWNSVFDPSNTNRAITFTVRSYASGGAEVSDPSATVTITCVFNVTNLQLGTPEGNNQIRYCPNNVGNRYIGLTWATNPGAEGYYIYANGMQVGQIPPSGAPVGTAVDRCGYSVNGSTNVPLVGTVFGCFNLNPGAWSTTPTPNLRDATVTYMVVPYTGGGAIIAPFAEAPTLTYRCAP